MTVPARPTTALFEGPAKSCIISGRALGWTNCTPCAFCMGIAKSTLGRHQPSTCAFRRLTGDTSGGTTIPQNAAVAEREYGVSIEVRVGSNVCSPNYAAGQLYGGRGFVLQGNAGALLRTAFRSTQGYVNHAVWANEGRGWHAVNGVLVPSEVLVYDPAADGRVASWGRADRAPGWWPWSLVLAFAAALRPWGDNDKRILGSGKFYAALFPDTEPHVHLAYAGSRRTSPMPRALVVRSPNLGRRVNERSGPSTAYPVVRTLADGTRFTAWQENPSGQLLAGSRLWYGDHDGRLWVHSSGVR